LNDVFCTIVNIFPPKRNGYYPVQFFVDVDILIVVV